MITNKDKDEIFRLFNDEHKTKSEIASIMSIAHPTVIYHLKRPGKRIVERKSKPIRIKKIINISNQSKIETTYKGYVKKSMQLTIIRDERGKILDVITKQEVSSHDVSLRIQNSICPKFFASDGKRISPLVSDATQPGIETDLDDDTPQNNIRSYI